ncbi:MAG: pre-peptidase C-terminal domain-containing protein, partial [Planctomycetaceae bacterium]|nr:pre-peptidase C-terminal domain-containing protein [Planctomycetaceae bacterium]
MAAPFVSGLVALVQDAAFTFGGRFLSVEDVVSIIRDSANTIFDAQTSSTQRAKLIENSDGSVSLGPIEELYESQESYLRVNALNAIAFTQDMVSGGIDPDNNGDLAGAIEFPGLDGFQDYAVSGNIGQDGPMFVGPNDVDLFRVVVESPGRLTVRTEPVPGGVDFDPFLRIFREDGIEIAAENNTAGNLYPELTTGILSPGVYNIGLSSFSNTNYDPQTGNNASGGRSMGDYQFTVSLSTPDPTGMIAGAAEVDLTSPNAFNPNSDLMNNGVFVANRILGQMIGNDPPTPFGDEGSITSVGTIFVGPTDVDFYRVVAPDTGQLFVEIDTSLYGSAGIDSFVEVFTLDSNGNLQSVNTNDNKSGSTTDSFLAIPVTIGQTYFIAVTSSGNWNYDPVDPFTRSSSTNDTGHYDLYLSFTNGDVDGTAYGANDYKVAAGTAGMAQGTIGSDPGQSFLGAQN